MPKLKRPPPKKVAAYASRWARHASWWRSTAWNSRVHLLAIYLTNRLIYHLGEAFQQDLGKAGALQANFFLQEVKILLFFAHKDFLACIHVSPEKFVFCFFVIG